MISLSTILISLVAYMLLLYGVALWVQRAPSGKALHNNRWIYALSLTVYCSTWTYYGSVGSAADSGPLFLAIYIGPTLALILGTALLRKLIFLKDEHKIVSIADLLASRYGKSRSLGALATLMLTVGTVPYVALQIKAMLTSIALLSGADILPASTHAFQPAVWALLGMMALLTIALGLRKLDPTERHPGMMAALSFEALVKLGAFLVAGVFVVWGLFDGPAELLHQARSWTPVAERTPSPTAWLSQLVLGASAFLFLPRQFHVAVVENSSPSHVRTAGWAFPLYLFAINLFVFPIALGGLRYGIGGGDRYVLLLPLLGDRPTLAWFVFLGGISAGTAMIMTESMAIASMWTNHFLLPAIDTFARLRPLRKRVLPLRRLSAAVFLLLGYLYAETLGRWTSLVDIGLTAFCAVLQLAPSILAALYWRAASFRGAAAAMLTGFLVWIYTLLLPQAVSLGWLPQSLLSEGLLGCSLLRPEALFGLEGLDRFSHAVFWSMLLNVGLLWFVSLVWGQSTQERQLGDLFVDAQSPSLRSAGSRELEADIDAAPKRRKAARLLQAYHDPATAETLASRCLEAVGAEPEGKLSLTQLAELSHEVERRLASIIGAGAAHAALSRHPILSAQETEKLADLYANLVADMRLAPSELKARINYYRERESLLSHQTAMLQLLSDVSDSLARSIDYPSVLRAVATVPLPVAASAVVVCLLERGETQPAPQYRYAISLRLPEQTRGFIDTIGPSPSPSGPLPHLAEVLRTGRPAVLSEDYESAWTLPQVSRVPVSASLTLPLRARGGPLGCLALLLPVRHTWPHEELQQLQEIAYRCAIAVDNARLYKVSQENTRARETFLSIASHELKTPLTALRAQVQLLAQLSAAAGPEALSGTGAGAAAKPSAGARTEKIPRLLAGIDEEVGRLGRLITELLDVSRLLNGRMQLALEEVDLRELVQRTTERLRPQLERAGCTLTLELEPARGSCDPLRFEQVLTNLLTNAARYACSCPVLVRCFQHGDRIRISVRDEGPGIAEADQERIFNQFERLANARTRAGGFGLGLFIAKQIILAHQGTIRVESKPGKGAEFVIELPSSLSAAAPAARRA